MLQQVTDGIPQAGVRLHPRGNCKGPLRVAASSLAAMPGMPAAMLDTLERIGVAGLENSPAPIAGGGCTTSAPSTSARCGTSPALSFRRRW